MKLGMACEDAARGAKGSQVGETETEQRQGVGRCKGARRSSDLIRAPLSLSLSSFFYSALGCGTGGSAGNREGGMRNGLKKAQMRVH